MTRTSTELLPLQPTGRTSPVASTRSSACLGFERQARRPRRAAACRRRPRRACRSWSAKAPGKAPGYMAEQLAVDDVGGDRLAVDGDQRAAGAQAGGVDRAGEGFLAGAGLADDQDRQAVARRLGGDRERGAEIGRGADQLLERQVGRELLGQRAPARRRRGGGRRGRRALRAAARARPAWRGNRWRRRASPRPRARPSRRRQGR